jgi:hypothetical protein
MIDGCHLMTSVLAILVTMALTHAQDHQHQPVTPAPSSAALRIEDL